MRKEVALSSLLLLGLSVFRTVVLPLGFPRKGQAEGLSQDG